MTHTPLYYAKMRTVIKALFFASILFSWFPWERTGLIGLLPDRIQRKYTAEQNLILQEISALKSPLILHENRVIFIQPDWTVTILDRDSGEVIKRNTTRRAQADFGLEMDFCSRPRRWETVGNIAYMEGGWPGFLILTLEDGNIDTSFKGNMDPVIEGSTLIMSRWNTRKIIGVDTRTLAVREFGKSDQRSYAAMKGRLVVFAGPHENGKPSLDCYDLASGTLLWSRAPDDDSVWLGMAGARSFATVFTVSPETMERLNSTPQGRSKEPPPVEKAITFALDGTIHREEAVRIRDFGGMWPAGWGQWARRFTYKGVEYENGHLYSDITWDAPRRELLKKAAAVLGRNIYGQGLVSADGSVVGIEYVITAEGFTDIEVFCSRSGGEWRAKIKPLEGKRPPGVRAVERNIHFFRLRDDRTNIYFATPDGRVECLDKKTGRSKWIYSFPVVLPPQSQRSLAILGTEVNEYYRAAFGQPPPTTVRGNSTVPSPRIVVDPAPLTIPAKRESSPLSSYGIPLISLCVLFLITRAIKPGGLEAYASRCRVLFWVNASNCYFTFSFDGAAMYLQLTVLVLIFILGEHSRWQISREVGSKLALANPLV